MLTHQHITMRIILIISTLMIFSPCKSENAEFTPKLFNALYHLPNSETLNACIIDTRITPEDRAAYLEVLDRTIVVTDFGILYSDFIDRNRITYIAPVACDEISVGHEFDAATLFDAVEASTIYPAERFPSIRATPDISRSDLIADFDNAAFAADFTTPDTEGWEEAKTYFDKMLCVKDWATRAQMDYGVPILEVWWDDETFIVIYNMTPDDNKLVFELIDYGKKHCDVDYSYVVRGLTDDEKNKLRKVYRRNN